MDKAKHGIGDTLIYFSTEEINKESDRVEVAGGNVIRPKLNAGDFGFIV